MARKWKRAIGLSAAMLPAAMTGPVATLTRRPRPEVTVRAAQPAVSALSVSRQVAYEEFHPPPPKPETSASAPSKTPMRFAFHPRPVQARAAHIVPRPQPAATPVYSVFGADPYTTAGWPQVGMAPRNSVEACISRVEHGGSYSRSTNGQHFGRWQLSVDLWLHYAPQFESIWPGITGRWGWAGPLEQDAVFRAIVAVSGYSNWSRWDNCW